MAKLSDIVSNATHEDPHFVGTVAFRNEEMTLPDGSSVALGIDGPRWVVVYQQEPKAKFKIYEYDHHAGTLKVDKKPGKHEDYEKMKKLVKYFFSHAHSEDLVTIMPPR